MLTIRSFSEGMDEIKFVLEKHGALTYTSVEKATKTFRDFLRSENTIQKACEATVERIERECRAIRKSEAEAVANVTSNDWNYPPTRGQTAAAATHALRVQGIAQATQRQLQTWGINDPNEKDVDRAMAAVFAQLNLTMVSYEGEAGVSVVHSNPAVAAMLGDRKDGTIWEMDMASDRQRDLVDEQMASNAVISNFEGVRNLGYTNPRRPMPDGTNFSGSGTGPSVGANSPAAGAGGAVAGPTTDLNAASLAAAYAAGVAAGSNFAKASRRSR